MDNNNLKKKTLKGAIWASVERFSGQGIQFLVMIVMARLLSPADYGLVGMVVVFTAISQTLIDGGFSQALIRKQNRTDIDNSTAFYFNSAIGAILYILLYISAPVVADFYKEPSLTEVMRGISLTVVFNSLAIVQIALYTSRVDFKTQSKATITAAIISGIVGIVTAYNGAGVWALVYQQVSNSFLYCVLLWTFSRWYPKLCFSMSSFKEMFAFGSRILASSLLNTIYNNLYQLVIGKIFNASSLGHYSRASHFSDFPSANVSGVLQRVTYPVLCNLQNDDIKLADVYRKFIRISTFIIFPLMMILAGISKSFIFIVLGEKWMYCATLLTILCFSRMWYPIHHLNVNLIQAKGRSDLTLRIEVYKKIIGVLVLIISAPLGLLAMCYAAIINCLISLYINTFYTGKIIQIGFMEQMKDVFPSCILSFVVFLSISFLDKIIQDRIFMLIIGILLGSVLYIGLAFLFKFKELKEIKTLMR